MDSFRCAAFSHNEFQFCSVRATGPPRFRFSKVCEKNQVRDGGYQAVDEDADELATRIDVRRFFRLENLRRLSRACCQGSRQRVGRQAGWLNSSNGE